MKRLFFVATAFAALFCGPAAVAGRDHELVGPSDTDHTVCSTDLVRIGQDGHLAPAMPFVTHAHPDRPGDGS
jgi:hypothetical protein